MLRSSSELKIENSRHPYQLRLLLISTTTCSLQTLIDNKRKQLPSLPLLLSQQEIPKTGIRTRSKFVPVVCCCGGVCCFIKLTLYETHLPNCPHQQQQLPMCSRKRNCPWDNQRRSCTKYPLLWRYNASVLLNCNWILYWNTTITK